MRPGLRNTETRARLYKQQFARSRVGFAAYAVVCPCPFRGDLHPYLADNSSLSEVHAGTGGSAFWAMGGFRAAPLAIFRMHQIRARAKRGVSLRSVLIDEWEQVLSPPEEWSINLGLAWIEERTWQTCHILGREFISLYKT